MAQETLNGPASPYQGPPTRDSTTEGGDNWQDFVAKCGRMFTELYATALTLAGVQTISGVKTFAAEPLTSVGVGAVAGTGITVSESGNAALHRTTFTLTAHSLTMTDAGAAGCHGSQKIYDFPEGHILILGAHCVLTVTAGAGGIADTAVLDLGVGSAAAGVDNDELATTEANVLHVDELELADGVAAADDILVANLALDGSATAADLYLNVAVDADDASASDTLAVTGTITVLWTKLGDD